MTQAKPLTDHDLREAIIARYEPPEWRLEHEVTLAGRRLDVVAFNLFQSRQFRVVGFELKVSRGDWLRELADVRKNEEWCRVVDDFYIVTAPKIIAKDEVPAGWGHLELCGSRMMKRAVPSSAPISPTLPREVVARFLARQAEKHEHERTREREQMRRDIYTHLRDQAQADVARRTEDLEAKNAALEATVAQFCDLAGIPDTWGRDAAVLRCARVLAEFRHDEQRLRQEIARSFNILDAHHRRLSELVQGEEVAA